MPTLCSLLVLLTASAAADKPLVWGSDAQGGLPYISEDPNTGGYVGFEVEIMARMGEFIKQPLEFRQYEFASLLTGVNRGDLDLAINGLEVTPENKKLVLFSRPYYIYEQQLMTRADDDRFQGHEDLIKLRDSIEVGTIDGTAAARWLDKHGIKTRLYDGAVEPYKDLELGRIDAVFLDLAIAAYYGKPNPKLKYTGDPCEAGYYAIAFRKTDEALCEQVNDGINKMIADGSLRRIYEKWGLWNDRQFELSSASTNDVRVVDENWDFHEYMPKLLAGAVVTVYLSVASMAVAMTLGLVVALGRMYGPFPARWLAIVFIEFFRGIPVLLLLFFIYFGLPAATGLRLDPLTAAIVGFGLNYAAYEAEIYRAGISSIPRGQWEAAASLGMNGQQTFTRIIFPQAIRTILPPSTNDFVALFKDTSVVSIIAVEELTKSYNILAKASGQYVEIGLATAMLYLVMSAPLGYLSRYLERKWGSHINV